MDPHQQKASGKRQAMTGQWQTPPLPVYAASQQQQPPPQQQQQHPQQQQGQAIAMPPPPALPESTDDYAKALQEAYRRGAEAAAALQMQPPPPAPQPPSSNEPYNNNMSNAASCPNFQQMQHHHHPHAHPSQQHYTSTEMPEPAPLVPNPLLSGPPAPPPPHHHMAPPQPAPPPPQAQAPPPQPHYHQAPHPGAPAVPAPSTTARSFSLPDMASYAVRAQAEEEKRKKRLARNRASARLRRLRKKNLVDSYEGEVGVLEQSLQKLKAHEWGSTEANDDSTANALLEALGMERGQQVLEDNAHRNILLKQLWKQQRDQVQYVRDCQLEQQVLQALVSSTSEENDEEDASLLQELQDVLQLSPEQRESLQHATHGLEEDVQAMETVDACLKAMEEQDWLLENKGVTAITSQFTSILHANQISKFLLWTDANSEAMDQLDYIHASSGSVQSNPIFSFGMDDYYPSVNAASSAGGGGGGSSNSLMAMEYKDEEP